MEQENEKPVMKNGIFTIVGLGASAGGLEAYEEFFSQLPANPGCAFVLVMHLDPHHKSMLPDILSKVTGMQVVQAEDGMKVAPNRIHVIPPDTTMFVDGDSLKVEKAKPARGARKPIDEFFRSLAEQKGDKAVGIIFSGTGSDGTQGLREIKFAGGMSMVQDPSTAKFDAMPANAIQAGVVDVVDSSSELAHKLSEYLEKRGEVLRDKAQRGGQDELEELLDEIHAQTGRDVAVYKRSTLMRRIEKRMLLKERLSIGEYKKFLQENEEEVNELLKELLIGVTSFFRDSEAFETIHKKVLPKIFSEKDKNESVRIWVPGCASGEEAYSIAMLVSKYMEENKSRRKIQIFATDVDDDAIAQARNGIYPTNAVGDVPEEYRERYMNERNGHHQVSTKIREMVVFAPHDLIDNPPFFKLDLISCRNLLIYLNPDVQKRIIPLFFYSLLSGGYLVLGPAETLGKHSELFEPVNSKWKIFQRKDIPSKRVDIPMSSRGAWTGAGAKVQKYQPWEKETSRETRPDYKSIMQDALVRNFAVPSVLINENDAIIQVHGDVHDYFGLTEGDPSSDVYRMARSPLRPHLRSAVHKARSKGEKIRYKGLNFGNNNDLFFNLTVSPADGGQSEKGGILLIAFEPLDKPGEDYQQMPAEVARDELVNQLEEELRISNDQLQSTIENLDSANEELKSSNEELMSMNEELQSSNEELETSQEELQALNEELSTVNSELQAKISELDEAKSDLENLLRSTDIATLFIDRGFVIRQFTPAVTNIFNIEEGDIGRPLKHFANKAPGEDIIGDARNVLKNLEKREKEIRTEDGKWYLSRIFPYRSLDDTIDGVVLTYVDITERKKMEDELREHRDNLEELV
jgi:two-component system CheB/CheR fusion protein